MRTIKIILLNVIASFLVSILVLGAAAWCIYSQRSAIFNSFVSRYLTDAQSSTKNGDNNQEDIANRVLGGGSTVENVVAKVNPAVVAIVASKDVPVMEQYFDNNSSFGDFFGFQIPQYRQNGTQKQEVGSGSGFFVSGDGLLVTNKHVVADTAAEYTVLTNDNQKYTAKVLARDPSLDIAILKIDKKDTPFINLGDSDKLKLGQSVVAIGNALGEFHNSVSVGIVSGLSRSITAGTGGGNSELLEQVIQTDAAINPGNSGGPLLDLSGKAIGINVAVASGSENIGFALPINIVKNVVNSVEKYGEIVRPYLGIRYIQIDKTVKEKNNLSVDYGILIIRGSKADELAIIPDSPADKAGLLENDIVLSADGKKLDGTTSLSYIIRQKQVGDEIILKVLSKGAEKEVKVKLEKNPNNS